MRLAFEPFPRHVRSPVVSGVVLLLVWLVVSSCGGTRSQASPPQIAVERLWTDFIAGDLSTACRTLTPDFNWGSTAGDTVPSLPQNASCEEVLDVLRQARDGFSPGALSVTSSVVRGGSARVQTSAGSVLLVKAGREAWRIADASFLSEG